MKTGNTKSDEDDPARIYMPQWSPVMKTGNTSPTGSRPFVPAARLNGARS